MSDCPPPNPPLGPLDPGTGGGGGGGCQSDVEVIYPCDLVGDVYTPFIRRLVLDCDGQVTAFIDTAMDGLTPYLVAGTVTECACVAEAVGVQPRHELLAGVGSFALPANALSVTVIVRNVGAVGSVTLTTTDGTVPLLENETVSWSVARDQDTALTGPWGVDTTNAADEVLVIWSEAV